MRGLPLAAWAYIVVVVALAASVIALSSYGDVHWATLGVLAVLFLMCESVPALLNIERARVSLSFAAGLASVVLAGPVGAALVGATAVVTIRRDVAPHKRLFNGAQFALVGFCAGTVFHVLGGRVGVPTTASLPRIIGPYLATLTTYCVVNLALMAGVLRLSRQVRTTGVRWAPVLTLAGAYLSYGMFGLLIAALWGTVGPFSAVLILLPLFVARWAFEQTRAQQKAYDATIGALCQAVETKDWHTRGHSERVSHGSALIAREVGMRPERVAAIASAGMLHDVGKLGVPTKVLQKPGNLTEEEYAAVQLHPMRGREIVREIGFLDEAVKGIMHHHERMDGTGYPMGLAGSEIPEFARVIAVADTFDVLTSDRPYRAACPIEEAVAELRRSAGPHLDPRVVDAFVAALDRHGWNPPRTPPPFRGADVETTRMDHDDPTAPLQVVRGEVRQ